MCTSRDMSVFVCEFLFVSFNFKLSCFWNFVSLLQKYNYSVSFQFHFLFLDEILLRVSVFLSPDGDFANSCLLSCFVVVVVVVSPNLKILIGSECIFGFEGFSSPSVLPSVSKCDVCVFSFF